MITAPIIKADLQVVGLNDTGLNPTAAFRQTRDTLLKFGNDLPSAQAHFAWPRLEHFNWARDWFDVIASEQNGTALWIATPSGDTSVRYADLATRSNQVAAWLQGCGVERGDRVLILMRNSIALYEILLAAIKLGAVVIPSYVAISASECADRLQRGKVRHLIADMTVARSLTPFTEQGLGALASRIVVGHSPNDWLDGWLSFEDSRHAPKDYAHQGDTGADEPLFGYFTSGTTSQPKLVMHTHTSYPIGHLSGMYWNGVRPGDVHLNVSNPGWAKHAWSSFFVPWNAEATIVSIDADEITPALVLDILHRRQVTTFCAPPTLWRMLIANGLGQAPRHLREAVSAGEPLEPNVIALIQQVWGIQIRDGYGQTETTAQIGNTPGQPIKPGSMGRALPGYDMVLIDPKTGKPGREGEICVDLQRRPVGIMAGYDNDPVRNAATIGGRYYRTGDIASIDDDGYFTFVGRIDDVFKSFDYRISPFELERVLLEHPAVLEAAIIPSPDPIGLVVPKAFVRLNKLELPNACTARSIDRWMSKRLPVEYRVHRLTFVEHLPKTISGKIRRSELRLNEAKRLMPIVQQDDEFFLNASERRAAKR